MKKSILILFVLLSHVCMGQNKKLEKYDYSLLGGANGCVGYSAIENQTRSLSVFLISNSEGYVNGAYYNKSELDSLACKERGHVPSGGFLTTCMYCPDYVIDTDSTSILVHPACNTTWYTCGRCLRQVSEHGKETREIIWKNKFKK